MYATISKHINENDKTKTAYPHKTDRTERLCFSKVSRPYQSHQHALVTFSYYVHPEIKINRLILHCINHFIGSIFSLPFFIRISRCFSPKLFILCHSTFSYCFFFLLSFLYMLSISCPVRSLQPKLIVAFVLHCW